MDPFSWFFLISALVGAYTAREQGQQQTAAVERNARLQENDRRRQMDEAFRASTAEVNEQARRAQADLATFDTLVGEFGGGGTATRGRAVMGVNRGEQAATLASNALMTQSQLGFQGLGNQARADSTLASIDRPSLLGTALQIGAGYMKDKDYQSRTKRPN